MDWILYVASAICMVVTIILAIYLMIELFELIRGKITLIRWRTQAEKELRFRISELEKKVLGSNED